MAAEQSATSRDPRVNASMGTAVNSVVIRTTTGQEESPMEQETAPEERINKTPLLAIEVVNVRLFLRWLKEQTGEDGSERMQDDKVVFAPNTADYFRATVRV